MFRVNLIKLCGDIHYVNTQHINSDVVKNFRYECKGIIATYTNVFFTHVTKKVV